MLYNHKMHNEKIIMEAIVMTYKQLLDYVKNNPGCLQNSNQKMRESEIKYNEWLSQYEKSLEKKDDK